MALITSYSDANKERHQLSAERTVRTLVRLATSVGGTAWQMLPYWYVETITTERFSYVGMTAAAAATCQAAMVTAWTKSKDIPFISDDGTITTESKQVVCADIRANHTGGSMWQVDVDVNETDITIEAYTPPE
jgi:hypothetical protein